MADDEQKPPAPASSPSTTELAPAPKRRTELKPPPRDRVAEIGKMYEGIQRQAAKVVQGAAYFMYSDEELDEMVAEKRLTKRQAAVARAARTHRAHAPYGLQIMHEQAMVRARSHGEKPQVNVAINIATGVQLPPPAPRADDSEVKIIDVDVTDGKEE